MCVFLFQLFQYYRDASGTLTLMEEYRYSSPVQILRQKKDVIYVATTTDVRLPFNSILVMDSKVNTYLCKSTAVSMHAYQIVMILKCSIALI